MKTVLGILLLRVNHGLDTMFDSHMAKGDYLFLLAGLIGIQISFLLLATVVLRAQGYFGHYVWGPDASAGSYGLVCPGVAASVMSQFFINKGLVGAGVLAKFGLAYWALTAISLLFLAGSAMLILVLNRKHFSLGSREVVAA